MITHRPTINRLPRRVASMVFAALLVLVLPLAAQRSAHGGGGGGSHGSSGGGSHGSSGGGGRSAHGVPGGGSSGGGQRQPGGHGGRGGGFHGRGGYYGPGYYPYWGWGWPGFSFYWNYPYYYGYPYGYYGYYDGPGYYDGGGYYSRGGMGALDLDVSPGRTHVFVNGEDLGEVDRYDGWPGYLWLPRGTYDIAFYLDGYKTIARQVTVYPGNVIDFDDRMEKGPSTRPEDLVSKSHERRDARIQYERERSEQIDRQGGYDDEDWQDRVHRDRDRGGDRADGSRGHLRLSVEPDDASVYLDGQFVGTGTDLSQLRGGLAVGPGTHHIAVVRPGHKAVEKDFTVQGGQDVRLDIALETGSR